MKVSIVIPTYNRPDFLDRLLQSVSSQTHQDYEVIVVDDISPNLSDYIPVIDKYKAIFSQFNFLSNELNRGAPYSRNRGILESQYDLVALVDDDDEWLPSKLEKQVKLFAANDQNIGLVYTWADAVDVSGNVVHKYRSEFIGCPKKEILRDCFIPAPSVMVRKNAIIAAGLFDESFPSCQDWDMWTRIIMKGYEVRVVKDVVTFYHKHNNGNIGLSKNAKIGYKMYYKKNLVNWYYNIRLLPKFLKYGLML